MIGQKDVIVDIRDRIYKRRFYGEERFRRQIWTTLCEHFFQKYVHSDSVVVDVGAGDCGFINNIQCKKKIAIDENPALKEFASTGVEAVIASVVEMGSLADDSADIVFASNVFEHLEKKDIVKSLTEISRVLKEGGKLLILQPNIRYCWRDYWMFFDHITPLDDRSMREILEAVGFEITECRARFLPYTTKSCFKRLALLLKIYLKMPLFQWLFGRQMFIVAIKQRTQ